MNKLKVVASRVGVGAGALVPVLAMAAEPDYSTISDAAVWTSVAAGIVLIFTGKTVIKVAMVGARALLRAFGG